MLTINNIDTPNMNRKTLGTFLLFLCNKNMFNLFSIFFGISSNEKFCKIYIIFDYEIVLEK